MQNCTKFLKVCYKNYCSKIYTDQCTTQNCTNSLKVYYKNYSFKIYIISWYSVLVVFCLKLYSSLNIE